MFEQMLNGESHAFYNEINDNEYEIKNLNKKIEKIKKSEENILIGICVLSFIIFILLIFKYIRMFLIYTISYIIILFNYITDGITSFILDIDKQVSKKETSSLNEEKLKKIIRFCLVIVFIILLCLILYFVLHNPPTPKKRLRFVY